MPDRQQFILHLDMNSFFASVEQQANPWLRGKAIGVGGRPGMRSIVAAASYEAKRAGVKTAMGTAEALAACPGLILVTGDNRRYHDVSRQFNSILLRFTPDVEAFSVDESFLAIAADSWQAAANIALAIKAAIREEIGDCLSCSIGLSTNRMLAKLGSDTLKPDGLHIITPTGKEMIKAPTTGLWRSQLLVESVDDLVLRVSLIDFCGLGPRLARHLGRLGIRTTADLRTADPSFLRQIFGVTGVRLWDWSWGRDDRPVQAHFGQSDPKSITRSITLPPGDDTPVVARRFLLDMAERCGRELRQQGLAGRRVMTWVGFADRSYWGCQRLLSGPIEGGEELYTEAEQLWSGLAGFKPIRQVGVGIGLLNKVANLTQSWLPDDNQKIAIWQAQDAVRRRFGDRAICRAARLAILGRQAEAAHAFGFRFTETS